MSNCLQTATLNELAQSTLLQFDQRISNLPPDLCSGFNSEARSLEAELLTIYRLVAICVREEEDLDKIAERWGTMVAVCDEFSKRLGCLKESHPNCGAGVYYDRILDLRNKCQRLQDQHA